MAEILTGTVFVQSILEDIFQRIEQAGDREARTHEAQCARSQIIGMQKLVTTGREADSSLAAKQGRGNAEYQEILNMLYSALERIEQLIE